MSKFAAIILVIVVLVAAGLYLAFGLKDKNEPQQQASDPNYVEYVDSTNKVRFMHHKDWTAVSTFGFVRLTPKVPTTPGQYEAVEFDLWAEGADISNPAFKASNPIEITAERSVRVRNEETPWQGGANSQNFKTTKTYLHWSVSEDRNVLVKIEPGQGNDLDPRIKKVIETMKFE